MAVVNPVGTNLVASAAILSALASLMPLIARRFFFGAEKKCPKGKLAQAFLTSFAKKFKGKILIQNKANNEATMNQKEKLPFFILLFFDRNQPMTQPSAGKKACTKLMT